ncbi:hypothetical protein B0H10DRAFT_1941722 [Mycena sp. CBHHK59/15]|nr:hypothetical protein B0H10DRAFT_1941722 [Mycena sp. CBHHK59/15]
MGNYPSLFDKTPEEHAVASARQLEKRRATLIWPPDPFVPLGHVRVQFYAYRHQVHDNLRPDMETIMPLSKSGELSLFAVRRLWGLETCSIIDSLEPKLGFAADSNTLCTAAVKQLVAKHGCIKLIEPDVSYETLAKRQIRHIVLGCATIAHFSYLLMRDDASRDYRAVKRTLERFPYRIHGPGAARLTVVLALLYVVPVVWRAMGIDLGRVEPLVQAVSTPLCLSLYLQFGLVALFFGSISGYSWAMELEEDDKIMLVLWSGQPNDGKKACAAEWLSQDRKRLERCAGRSPRKPRAHPGWTWSPCYGEYLWLADPVGEGIGAV